MQIVLYASPRMRMYANEEAREKYSQMVQAEQTEEGNGLRGMLNNEVAPILLLLLLCRKTADYGIDRHDIAIITLKSISRS